MASLRRGSLLDGSAAPAEGERHASLAQLGGAAIEQIVSAHVTEPQDYLQDHDEWVVVLAGRAAIDVEGAELELHAGDWVVLPAHRPHRLLRTERGTVWLAVHAAATA